MIDTIKWCANDGKFLLMDPTNSFFISAIQVNTGPHNSLTYLPDYHIVREPCYRLVMTKDLSEKIFCKKSLKYE